MRPSGWGQSVGIPWGGTSLWVKTSILVNDLTYHHLSLGLATSPRSWEDGC
ncbi:hypothetical protein HanPSC8_Chr03g0101041 [Helianthus annuus]|nr:hypothetical protein HanPSC8_Chr03g0101041 [Helianthus annuus]